MSHVTRPRSPIVGPDPIRDREAMISQMRPRLRSGAYVFTVSPNGTAPPGLHPVMTFTEDEGLTLILSQDDADRAGLPYDLVTGWITLQVTSALDGVGLTAAVGTALAEAGIACNMVAGAYHDHLFVPLAQAAHAVHRLEELAAGTG